MSDLAEFLLARIAEDEALARVASPGPWHVDAESATVLAVDDIEVCDGFALGGPQLRATTAHIARHDPARVLAECEAKRGLLRHLWVVGVGSHIRLDHCDRCQVIRYFGAAYASHPDYRSEWAP